MKKAFRNLAKATLLLAALALSAMPAAAVDYDFSGIFRYDNDRLLFNFTVGGVNPSLVTVFSSSWLYGNPPLGMGLGGFDPMLGIWTASGNLVAFQDDGLIVGATLSNGVSYNHGFWDSYYQVLLSPGDYIASVTQFSNFNNGATLAAGFRYDGNPDFTWDLGYGGRAQAMFNGVWDTWDPRTNEWAFHLLNVASANVVDPVPEPGTLVLLGSGLAGLAGYGRKRTKG